jgi:ROK family.
MIRSPGTGSEPSGSGAAGFVDSARATMLFAPNLAWRDEPLKQRVEERLGREVVVRTTRTPRPGPKPGSARRAGTAT